MNENHLHKFICDLAEHFRNDSDIKLDETLAVLSSFRSQLEAFYDKYTGIPPEGSEQMFSAMRASTLKFYQSLEDLELFIEEAKDELLDSAVQAANDGKDALTTALALAEREGQVSLIYA